ncbi:MAG: hypothetical protein UT48_C0047G0006 [Parcubacteria group bacterium GW2011_GWE2_39_37]|uniref:Uncharacterized protein n=1 Tax=Candidatus Falkowbacteria bacterium GW2011_GWF2_39_8 TaxID=1618642 RepID=A0A0G0SCN1_9BACT|nr:MAG: hypothetical protein UT48_C0047G0006 [Parcubacteria group bacterium GW2011_GWE2_39_37]KKR32500.1 MAG: hypothetical protein UT64_C0032G0014 [Candidatus Falkowbacteria bacterium GW2011_GWF2_39_8]
MSVKIAWRRWIDLTPLIKTDEGLDIELLKLKGMQAFGGRFQEFVFCSGFIWLDPDPRLESLKGRPFTGAWNWLSKWLEWNKLVVLTPLGHPETEFVVAYYDDSQNECKAFPRFRKVKEGPYEMRRGPNELCAFIIANAAVKLKKNGNVDLIGQPTNGEKLPNLDIY